MPPLEGSEWRIDAGPVRHTGGCCPGTDCAALFARCILWEDLLEFREPTKAHFLPYPSPLLSLTEDLRDFDVCKSLLIARFPAWWLRCSEIRPHSTGRKAFGTQLLDSITSKDLTTGLFVVGKAVIASPY